VAGTASRFEWRDAGHIKTSPAAVQLTTLEMAHRSGACHRSVLYFYKLIRRLPPDCPGLTKRLSGKL
jgi:hypothetical protein